MYILYIFYIQSFISFVIFELQNEFPGPRPLAQPQCGWIGTQVSLIWQGIASPHLEVRDEMISRPFCAGSVLAVDEG